MRKSWMIFSIGFFLFHLSAKAATDLEEFFDCDKKIDLVCNFLTRGIKRDTNRKLVDPQELESPDRIIDLGEIKNIKGHIRYLGFFPKSYRYQVQRTLDGELRITVKIFFKNYSNRIENKLRFAEEFWAEHLPYDYPVRFFFESVANKKSSNFRVNLVNKRTRGPYTKEWSLLWSGRSVAHEIGHMMGLDDEYSNNLWGGSSKRCIEESIMCRSGGQSHPMPFHYYQILRRVYTDSEFAAH